MVIQRDKHDQLSKTTIQSRRDEYQQQDTKSSTINHYQQQAASFYESNVSRIEVYGIS